ncbi:MAG TPA: hypothetical protein IAD11_02065 [Candidatus Stercorousia faecigallinarum]|nr:hypothetical protein [Candidatus Stercorousia faecigallinarum]
MTISPLRDSETLRQQRNLTTTQKRASTETKEGVLVNNFIKDCPDCKVNLEDTCDTLVISESSKMPSRLYEKNRSSEKNILPISAIATGVMGTIALLSAFVKRNTKINLNISNEKRISDVTRNLAINDEGAQTMFQMVVNPTRKTILAGIGVLTLSAMAFMGKTFFDGFKDVWVKKREADIQKDMQERLIDIETQSFAGKIQITRSMLSEKAREFSRYLSDDNEPILPNFGKHLRFTGRNDKKNSDNNNSLNYFLLGAGTVAAIIGLGYLSLKNLSKSKTLLEDYVKDRKNIIKDIVQKSTNLTKENDKKLLEAHFQSIDANADTIKEYLKGINWDKTEAEEFIQKLIKKSETSTTKVNETIGGDGTPKPTFYSHVDDYRAFFYNWLLDTDNKQFKQLFFGITGLTALSYGGKLAGDAVKEVQVKKLNAQTEVDLQNRLVSTELRNFKSKKEAAIQPLVDEFYKQAKNGKPKEELKVIADNILFEIKNGPPFVYS